MMKSKKSLSASDEESDINISPLIDMVFILLIFFIVTTVFVEEPGVDVRKPFAVNSPDLAKNVIMIAITENNQVVYGGKNYGVKGVQSIVRRAVAENEDMPVIIQADQQSHASVIVQLVNECKLAKAKRIYVSTERI